ncbi:MAG: hypothetical protein IT380_03395 [Myxococcales bacterium]|nr:hypothetical protein [Myxococcales bacterium]
MAKVPVFRISLTNATLLSGVYLVGGAAVELARRLWNPRWAERLSLSLEAFPARVLEFLGLFEPLRRAWLEGHLSELQVRLVYGLTTVALIYSLGVAVGGLMWGVARLAGKTDLEA